MPPVQSREKRGADLGLGLEGESGAEWEKPRVSPEAWESQNWGSEPGCRNHRRQVGKGVDQE